MSRADPGARDKWDRIYRERGRATREPAAFLVDVADRLPPAGRALDVAGGSGRNAVWLARRFPALAITVADISPVALALAAEDAAAAGVELETRAVDLGADPLPAGPWDLVVCFHYLDRALVKGVARSLAAGGMFAMVQPTLRNLERHAKPGRRFLLEEGELAALLDPELDVVILHEGWSREGRHEAELLARRPG